MVQHASVSDSGLQLRAAFDALGAHVCVLDADGRIVAVNQAWQAFAAANGARPQATGVGISYLEVCERAVGGGGKGAVTGMSRFIEQLRDVLAGRRRQFEFEYACHSPTNERWYLARTFRIDDGGPARAVVAHDDVTVLQQALNAVRRGEKLLLDLSAAIPGALFRLARRVDGHWHFVYLSPGVEALFGLPARRVRGEPALLWESMPDADLAAFVAVRDRAVVEGSGWEHTGRILDKSGEVRWIHWRASPRASGEGQQVWAGIITDVTAQKELESGLKRSEETFRQLFESVPQGIVHHAPDGRIVAANPAALRVLGLTPDQLHGRRSIDPRWKAVREDGSDFPGDEHPAMVAIRTSRPVNGVVMGVEAPGRGRVWILVDATPLFRQGVLDQVHVTFEDITERVQLARELQLQAGTDYLTGLANRRVLMERLKSEYERVRRRPDRPCAVIAMDIDHFKQVNDSCGHAAGDAVLVAIARLMQQHCRTVDTVVRSGGEEFTLLLPDTTAEAARLLGDRLRERIAGLAIEHTGRRVAVTVSLGVSAISAFDPDVDAVLSRADRALYEAKSAGRDQIRVLPPAR